MKLDDILSQLASLTTDALAVGQRDIATGKPVLTWVNDAFCEMFRQPRDELVNRDPYEVLHHSGYATDFRANFEEATQSQARDFTMDTKCIRGDGTDFWASVRLSAVGGSDGVLYAIMSVRDIDLLKSREQAAELALIENEGLMAQTEAAQSRLVNAINTTPDAFAIFNRHGRLEVWNPAFAAFTTRNPERLQRGMRWGEAVGISVEEGLHRSAIGRETAWLEVFEAGWKSGSQTEQIVSSGGRQYKVTQTVTPNRDRVVHCVDITDFLRQQKELESYAQRLKSANEEIRQQALHDELTGLGNRRYLNVRLEELIARREKAGDEIAALHIDLDRFKQINDTMGHTAGDAVLTAVAGRLKAQVREDDVIARTGGDEFVVLVSCSDTSDHPEILASRLSDELSKPVTIDGRPCIMGASIGVARTPVVAPDQLLTCSDIALYKAKEDGRSKVAFFDVVDLEHIRAAKALADDVVRGVEAGEFVPVYQPQVDPASGAVVALEVLARWQHPERGLLSPAAFLPTAADMKIDNDIDRMIFRTAIAECTAALGRLRAPPSLSFNVALGRLMGRTVLEDVERHEYPGPIAFELLETIFLEEESAEFVDRIEALRALGVPLEVDDFGSGRASIVGLRRIGPDRLKIDRRLIEPVASSESSRRLVRSIIEIGRALEIGVTAEGVETEAQAKMLHELGCDRLQGYLYSRPVPLMQVSGLRISERRAASA